MGDIRTHKGRQVHDYVFGNADRPLTLEQIARDVGWAPASVGTCLGRMLAKYPEHMQRTSKGVYRWNSQPSDVVPAVVSSSNREDMLISVLSRKEGKALVRDDETGELYVLTPFEF